METAFSPSRLATDAMPDTQHNTPFNVASAIQQIGLLCQRGGPVPDEYPAVLALFDRANTARKAGFLDEADLQNLRNAFGDAMGPKTMQGRSLLKRHGYAGDFEIIDQIYQSAMSDDPALRRWDEFFHAQGATVAVRNRKRYFINLIHAALLEENAFSKDGTLQVLNVASGPCRDIAEFFESAPDARVHFTCVDMDPNAIAYAKALCAPWLDRMTFICGNAFKLRLDKKFDVVWSAGLFDYFDDRGFGLLLGKLLSAATQKIVVGNFSDENPSAAYQEIAGGWFLNYRSADTLQQIAATSCDVSMESVEVDAEPQGINLFLRIEIAQ